MIGVDIVLIDDPCGAIIAVITKDCTTIRHFDIEAQLIEPIDWISQAVSIEIRAVDKTCWIGGEPALDGRIVKSSAKIDQSFIGPFGRKSPGIDVICLSLFSKCSVGICFDDFVNGCDGDEIAPKIVIGGINFSIDFDGNGSADISLQAESEDFELEKVGLNHILKNHRFF